MVKRVARDDQIRVLVVKSANEPRPFFFFFSEEQLTHVNGTTRLYTEICLLWVCPITCNRH